MGWAGREREAPSSIVHPAVIFEKTLNGNVATGVALPYLLSPLLALG